MDIATPCHFFNFSNIFHAIPIHPSIAKTTLTDLGVEIEAEMRVALRKSLALWQ